jgi:hypothetical protein
VGLESCFGSFGEASAIAAGGPLWNDQRGDPFILRSGSRYLLTPFLRPFCWCREARSIDAVLADKPLRRIFGKQDAQRQGDGFDLGQPITNVMVFRKWSTGDLHRDN